MNSKPPASNYDLVPYASYPFAHLHPAQLAAVAQLRGMKPPPVATARVLDLGCGAGGHIIPLAGFYPQMQLVGVDLAASQIDSGNERIRDLGLSNVSLHAGDLAHGLPASALEAAQALGGQFDYIVCQGVYYVVPDAVRSAIWQVLRQHLAPGGIAHISFNTYPGWKQREIAQDFAQFHAQGKQHENGLVQEQSVRDGLSLIAALAPSQAQGLVAGYDLGLKAEAQAAAHAVPGLLFHEFLSKENRPLYFSQMVSHAKEAGFAFLCEANLPDAWPGRIGQAGQALMAMADGDALRFEQYLDYATARTYRNSLWVAPQTLQNLPPYLSVWSPERLHGLHFAVDLSLAAKSAPGQQEFVSAGGMQFSVSEEKASGLRALVRQPHLPLWIDASALMQSHPQSKDALHESVLYGLLKAWREPPCLPPALPELRIPDWLYKDASRGREMPLVSCWHQPISLTESFRVQLLDLGASQQTQMPSDPINEEAVGLFHQLGWLKSSASHPVEPVRIVSREKLLRQANLNE